MSQSKDMFTADEVRDLIHIGQKVVFEAVRAMLKAHREEEYGEITVKLLRRNARLMLFPRLILEENPRDAYALDDSMSIECRESLFDLLGDRSRQVMSLSDNELIELVLKKIREYR
jgi:hypothetical protein